MAICAGPECTNEAKKKGLCGTHYSQQQIHGPDGLTIIGANTRRKARSFCTFEGCGKANASHGLCHGHAKQRREGRELAPLTRQMPTDVPIDMAYCSTCKEIKPKPEFSWDEVREQTKRVCLACHADSQRRRNLNDPRRVRIARMRSKYGIEPEQFQAMFDEQDGKCKICGIGIQNVLTDFTDARTKVAVDHDHKNGAVRGLLCGPCNCAIGYMADDPERLVSAAQYLRDFIPLPDKV